MHYYSYYEMYEDPNGFIVFTKNGDVFDEYDLYNDDVIYGTLHTTIDNYNNKRYGVLEFNPSYYSNVDMDNWHDPVLD